MKIVAILASLAVVAFSGVCMADPVGGPQEASGVLVPGDTMDVYIALRGGGEQTLINVGGNGRSDLDCWLINGAGEVVDSDTDNTDKCVLLWEPNVTRSYVVRIRNVGRYTTGYYMSAY